LGISALSEVRWRPAASKFLSRYAHLNPGQVGMNVGNKLRAIWTRGEPVKVGGQLVK
jgi:hypothetical protein